MGSISWVGQVRVRESHGLPKVIAAQICSLRYLAFPASHATWSQGNRPQQKIDASRSHGPGAIREYSWCLQGLALPPRCPYLPWRLPFCCCSAPCPDSPEPGCPALGAQTLLGGPLDTPSPSAARLSESFSTHGCTCRGGGGLRGSSGPRLEQSSNPNRDNDQLWESGQPRSYLRATRRQDKRGSVT